MIVLLMVLIDVAILIPTTILNKTRLWPHSIPDLENPNNVIDVSAIIYTSKRTSQHCPVWTCCWVNWDACPKDGGHWRYLRAIVWNMRNACFKDILLLNEWPMVTKGLIELSKKHIRRLN